MDVVETKETPEGQQRGAVIKMVFDDDEKTNLSVEGGDEIKATDEYQQRRGQQVVDDTKKEKHPYPDGPATADPKLMPEIAKAKTQEQDSLENPPLASHTVLRREGPVPVSNVGAFAIDGVFAETGSDSGGEEEEEQQQQTLGGSHNGNIASSSSELPIMLEATLVQDSLGSDPEQSRRNYYNGMEDTNNPMLIVEAKPLRISPRYMLLAFLCLAALVAGVTTGIIFKKSANDVQVDKHSDNTSNSDNDNDDHNTGYNQTIPTLELVRQRGKLRCGVLPLDVEGPIMKQPDIELSVSADVCKAIAAAIMGWDSYQIEVVPIPLPDRISTLQKGNVDVLIAAESHTMDRDRMGITFSNTYLYMTSGMAGERTFVQCAEDDFRHSMECADLKICALNGTRYLEMISLKLPKSQLIPLPGFNHAYDAFATGECNVLLAVGVHLNLLDYTQKAAGYNGDFVVGETILTKEPIAIVTRDDDHTWTTFCNAILQALIAADAHNITKNDLIHHLSSNLTTVSNLDMNPRLTQPTFFGVEYRWMFYNAIAAVGNYGESYTARLNPIVFPQETINHPITTNDDGAIASLPFGQIIDNGKEPNPDGTLAHLIQSRKFRCGIDTRSGSAFVERRAPTSNASAVPDTLSGTATFYKGMDVDLCRAVAASIFGDADTTVQFVEIANDSDGFTELDQGNIDILAGMADSLERNVVEPSTGAAFSFTSPYFYNNSVVYPSHQSSLNAIRCLATRKKDSEWSKYVFWVVEAIFYAEENKVNMSTSNEMPTVDLYGSAFTRMFRDTVNAVGNYGEIYERNVEAFFPRSGLNMLYDNRHPSPLLKFRPGILQ